MLAAGTTLGPYKILAPLGAGGMGEVYRAHDSRLGRDVAVKVLPQHLAATPEVRARFEREARTISQLNHPHICALHDVGHQDGIDYLVMELLEGETLAHRLERGSLPVAEVLALGKQIAEALDRAHRAGVVHRDLKPGNVMLTKSGAKLMDFGLARSHGLAPAASAMTQSPTVSRPLTAEGTIVGTFQYMAPEQLEGKEADARSDLWALGCVLYEMATGARAFAGESQASLIAAIMTGEPRAMTELRPIAPQALERLVRRCLAKDPNERFQSASDLAFAFEGIGASGVAGPAPASASRISLPKRMSWILPAAAALALLALGAVAGHFLGLDTGNGAPDAECLSISLPAGARDVQRPASLWQRNVAISPDERCVAFAATRGGTPVLFVRQLESFQLREVEGGGSIPFFSPDGASIGFLRGAEVWRTPVDRIAPVQVGKLPRPAWNVRDALWHRSGQILIAMNDGLFRMPANGGDATMVVASDSARNECFVGLSVLRDQRVLASVADASLDYVVGVRLAVIDPRIWRITRYVEGTGGIFARGWLITGSPTGATAARFDDRQLTIRGEPANLATALGSPASDYSALAVSESGSLAWFSAQSMMRQPVYVDRSGRESPLPVAIQVPIMRWPRLSPRGDRLVCGRKTAKSELDVFDLSTGVRTPLSLDGTEPVWMPDGSGIISSTGNFPTQGLALQTPDGRTSTTLLRPELEVWPTSVSNSGDLVLYYVQGSSGDRDGLYVMDLKSRQSTKIGLPGAKGARFSRDGRWIACQAPISGRFEVVVMSWPSSDRRTVVSSEGGTEPIWSPDGRELFYRNGDRVMAAQVVRGPGFATSTPRQLFSFPYFHDAWGDQSWDLAPDGRFLMVRETSTEPVQVELVRNALGLFERGRRSGRP